MTQQPTISVIMTVYNGEKFLQEAMDAVLQQTFRDFEFIVVNNGSTDSTPEILAACDDPRLRVVTPAAHGTVGDGLRFAYKHVTGVYVAVQDADDNSLPDRFEKQIKAFEDDPDLGLVCGGFQDIDEKGNLLDEHHPPQTRQELVDSFQVTNPLAHSTFMFKRSVTDKFGGYPDGFSYASDFGLLLGVAKSGCGIKVLDDVILHLRTHSGQISRKPEMTVVRAYEALVLLQEASNLNGVSPQARHAGKRTVAKCTVQYALALFELGRKSEGWKQIFVLLKQSPLYGGVYLFYRLLVGAGLIKK